MLWCGAQIVVRLSRRVRHRRAGRTTLLRQNSRPERYLLTMLSMQMTSCSQGFEWDMMRAFGRTPGRCHDTSMSIPGESRKIPTAEVACITKGSRAHFPRRLLGGHAFILLGLSDTKRPAPPLTRSLQSTVQQPQTPTPNAYQPENHAKPPHPLSFCITP